MDDSSEASLREKNTSEGDVAAAAAAAKEHNILEACRRRNLGDLRILAESPGGFLTDKIRQQAWPVLLGLPSGYTDESKTLTPQATEAASWRKLPRHRDEDQVQLDVNRAFIYYPNHKNEAELASQKDELSDLIVEVLRRHPYLCYFQGYHDICQVLLLVLPAPVRAPAVARLSALRIRDFMLPTLAPAVHQLRLIPDILLAADPTLWRHLASTEPFFALSGTLTMYAHDITTLGEITRLFDVLLAREPVFSVYMFAAIVRSRRDELFDTPADEPEMLHSILSKLPRPLDLEALITSTHVLYDTHPPEKFAAWRTISRASVLCTARDADACAAQSMADAERFFDRQVTELRWIERRDQARELLRRYRRPARTLGFAILIGVVAVWLRRSPGLSSCVTGLLASWMRL
ncbi:rab-GTPase-TBC domain-containing protein [Lasiosphaeria hispida]|uniref:Rab-GTPase-TBC domain-containing protein n=1 Tax=Lasiosphaeria hispida TaxID=260671 RepID=A0AAJ0HGR4_9PEZI|nr:rab-GTPase-TBC domain-containing protein [Lasiosphaeria hispida]